MLKLALFKIKGMNRDLSASAFNPEFAYENMNLRILSTDDNTLLSLTNEKGPLKADILIETEYHPDSPKGNKTDSLDGLVIGQCRIENFLILFLTKNDNKNDSIYKIYIKNGWIRAFLLYLGNLNFNSKHPIEALAQYENDKIKKVYWTDGINLPRVINIEVNKKYLGSTTFDFIKDLKLQENIKIKRNDSGNGIFAPGVIQYAFTYYNRYGQESNIFYTSSLYYTSYSDRGGSPEDKVSNSFTITLNNLDDNFEYVRIYSIFRSSENGIPEVKAVRDIKVTNGISFIDNGTTGAFVDPTLLLYIGGELIVALTLNQKDNTLFLGNLKYLRKSISKDIKDLISGNNITFETKNNIPLNPTDGLYSYTNLLKYNSELIKSFKYLEWYRFGVLFLHKSGKWSEPIYIKDKLNTLGPKAKASTTLSAGISTRVKELGYIKARPVIVYPSASERACICQGVLCPTIYNVGDRMENGPFVLSSWFGRCNTYLDFPIFPAELPGQRPPIDTDINDPKMHFYDGYIAEFRHNYPLPNNDHYNSEVLGCMISDSMDSPFVPIGENVDLWVSKNSNLFFVDLNIVTLHSPEVEYDSSFSSIDLSNAKLRIVGCIELSSNLSDLSITTSSTTNTFKDLKKGNPKGFVKRTITSTTSMGRGLMAGPFWFDALTNPKGLYENSTFGFMVYPWHRNGSLNNTSKDNEKGYRSAKLKNKKMSNLRVSDGNSYFSINDLWNNHNTLFDAKVFDSNELQALKLKYSNKGKFKEVTYYGNVDKVITADKDGYYIKAVYLEKPESDLDYFLSKVNALDNTQGTSQTDDIKGFDPIRIKYKSSPHIVLSLGETEGGAKYLLPNNGKNSSARAGKAFWEENYSSYLDTLNVTPLGQTMWLGELYRDVNIDTLFGGNTPLAIENNLWLPCGEPVNITEGGFTLNWTEGDTYYLRYDNLKTYPYTLEDQNSITEILSFMCETRINIDGRYDKNRGLVNNLVTTPKIFNLFNPVYSQENNFFNYRALNDERLNITKFNNTITWSKTKTLGELTDTWTNTTLASTLDLDGDKGELRALKRFNNNLIAFLDRGISLILYNENVQILSTEGVPIEIANSGKVLGKRYVTDKIGCTNKWSICEAPSGIYFTDDTTKNIYLFNGQANNISSKLGFNSWIKTKSNLNIWNPDVTEGFANGVTYYDNINSDVLFIYKDQCLAFSEPLGAFSSFYSYENIPYFSNLENKGLFITSDKNMKTTIWLHNEGDYNMFFGEYKPFYTNIVVNPDPTKDKIFNTLEFRSDSWYNDILMNETFDTIQVNNEYLDTGKVDLTRLHNRPANIKKKFRVWRVNIPRDSVNYRNRIRNPWTYIKLSREKINTYKTILHDIIVGYFE